MNNIYFPNHYRIIRNKEAEKRSNNRETVFPKYGNQPGTTAEEAAGGRTRPS